MVSPSRRGRGIFCFVISDSSPGGRNNLVENCAPRGTQLSQNPACAFQRTGLLAIFAIQAIDLDRSVTDGIDTFTVH